MKEMYELEISLVKQIVNKQEGRIQNLKSALVRFLKMMKYPRLVEMLNKQLVFENIDTKKFQGIGNGDTSDWVTKKLDQGNINELMAP